MLRFLGVLVTEFHKNNKKENLKCRSPSTTDQWTMNWYIHPRCIAEIGVILIHSFRRLYYNGYFGEPSRTKTIPWGTVGRLDTITRCFLHYLLPLHFLPVSVSLQGPVLTVGKACIGADKKSGASDIVWPSGKGVLLYSCPCAAR